MKTRVYKLNDYVTNKMEARQIIESTRQLMVNQFGLDIEVIINNTMSCRGRLNGFAEKDGIVSKFGNIEIKTSGSQTYKEIIKTVVHEFCHIPYSNCHTGRNVDSVEEDRKHYRMTEQLFKLTVINLKEQGLLV